MLVGGRTVWTYTVEGEHDMRIPPDTLIADYLGFPRRVLYFSTASQAKSWFLRLASPAMLDDLTPDERMLQAKIQHPWKLNSASN
jgi:hypothetical protein